MARESKANIPDDLVASLEKNTGRIIFPSKKLKG